MAQTYPHWTVALVGDCCPDLEAFMSEHKAELGGRVRWWNLSHNHGSAGYAARNYALKSMCVSDWVAYLDDDNYWEPHHLASLVQLVVTPEPEPAFVFSSLRIQDRVILCAEPRLYRTDTSCILHRRQLLHRFGYWRPQSEVGYANDWDLVARWRRGGQPWRASLLPTLVYEGSTQLADGLLTAYDRPADGCTWPICRAPLLQ